MGRYLYSSFGLGISYHDNPCRDPAFQGEIAISTTQDAKLDYSFDIFMYDSAFGANGWVVGLYKEQAIRTASTNVALRIVVYEACSLFTRTRTHTPRDA